MAETHRGGPGGPWGSRRTRRAARAVRQSRCKEGKGEQGGQQQQQHVAPWDPQPLPAAYPLPHGRVTHSHDQATQQQAAATGPRAHLLHAKINPKQHAKLEAVSRLTCAN